jgi:hypothetical protein
MIKPARNVLNAFLRKERLSFHPRFILPSHVIETISHGILQKNNITLNHCKLVLKKCKYVSGAKGGEGKYINVYISYSKKNIQETALKMQEIIVGDFTEWICLLCFKQADLSYV